MCILSTGVKFNWVASAEKKQVSLFRMRSEIEAKVEILRKPRHVAARNKMLEMIS